MEDVTHKVARQYTDYTYPPPIMDLAEEMKAGYFDLTDPSIFGPALWPEGRSGHPSDILIAGCGAHQAAVMAFNNPGCRVLGVDLSETSLGHERYLRERHKLDNLELAQGDLREVGKLGKGFDLIISTGVLHHMADPSEGLSALREVLKPDGAMGLMVYASVARSGIYPLQEGFRRMRLQQNAEGIAAVRAVLASLPPTHPAHAYARNAKELEHDTTVVDTFLHPQDRAYTVPELLEWVEANGLAFQGWIQNHLYYPNALIGEPTGSRLKTLPDLDQWVATEAFLGFSGKHTFVLRHPGRTKRPDFSGSDWLRYRPKFMPYIRVMDRGREPGTLMLQQLSFTVGPSEVEALKGVNGQAAIGAILERPAYQGWERAQLEAFGRGLFEHLWKIGAVMLELG